MRPARAARREVFVRGSGAVSGFGAGVETLTSAVAAGAWRCARRRTAGFAAPTAVVGEFPGGDLPDAPAGELAFAAAAQAAREALAAARLRPGDAGLVLASTKGDLSGIVGEGDGRGSPRRLAERIAAHLGLAGVHGAVSCACASGLVALAVAARRIAGGEVDHVLVVGVDVVCEFILTGFGGLHALDPGPCRPFDAARRGVSLGDGAGAILLSATPPAAGAARIAGFAGANDAST
ncbi:MAG: beta-ketoacyl synthase N-terminal-like domain-containing protein [Planctomycetota bacterium]